MHIPAHGIIMCRGPRYGVWMPHHISGHLRCGFLKLMTPNLVFYSSQFHTLIHTRIISPHINVCSLGGRELSHAASVNRETFTCIDLSPYFVGHYVTITVKLARRQSPHARERHASGLLLKLPFMPTQLEAARGRAWRLEHPRTRRFSGPAAWWGSRFVGKNWGHLEAVDSWVRRALEPESMSTRLKAQLTWSSSSHHRWTEAPAATSKSASVSGSKRDGVTGGMCVHEWLRAWGHQVAQACGPSIAAS